MKFQYIAYNKNGKRISATIEADSIPALVSRLKNQGLTPLRISKVRVVKTLFSKIKLILRRGRIKGMEVAIFTRQLATILDSGITLTTTINTISDDMENLYFRSRLKRILAEVNAGKSLSEALSLYPDIFPVTYVAVVRSGEEVGNLAAALANLAKYLEDYERMKQRFINAMRYPVFLLIFMIFVVSVIVIFLIPKFKALFTRAGSDLPLLTRIVVGISEFWLKNGLLGFVILVFLWILVSYLLTIFRIRFMFDYFKLKLPIIGKILYKAVILRFCRTFSILLSGGVSLVSALSVSKGVVKNLFLEQLIDDVKENVVSGAFLSETFKTSQLMPNIVVKMVEVGEKTGKLDEMLKRTADYYDKELEATLESFSAMIEPVFIILIGGIVLIVALALYLPIFEISKAMH